MPKLAAQWAPSSVEVEGAFPDEGPFNYELEDDKTALKGMLMAAAHVKTYGR